MTELSSSKMFTLKRSQRNSSTFWKRRGNVSPSLPSKAEGFDNLLKNSDLGTVDVNLFYRTFVSTNDEFEQKFLIETNYSEYEVFNKFVGKLIGLKQPNFRLFVLCWTVKKA